MYILHITNKPFALCKTWRDVVHTLKGMGATAINTSCVRLPSGTHVIITKKEDQDHGTH